MRKWRLQRITQALSNQAQHQSRRGTGEGTTITLKELQSSETRMKVSCMYSWPVWRVEEKKTQK